MAVWHFDFYLVSISALVRAFGSIPESIAGFATSQCDSEDGGAAPAYLDVSPLSPEIVAAAKAVLPEFKSWSAESRMFGSADGHRIELWPDLFFCRYDVRSPEPHLLESIAQIATDLGFVIVCKDDGRVIGPDIVEIEQQIGNSRAHTFLRDPIEFLDQLGQEVEDPFAGRDE